MTDLIYTGTDLGCTMNHGCTSFRIWAPLATHVELHLYKDDTCEEAYATEVLSPDIDGTWIYSGSVPSHTYYTYSVDGRETQDPYSKAVGCNGHRSMVLDLKETNPEGFAQDHGPVLSNPVDAIICETSILDATGSSSCPTQYPGKYLGLTETGLRTGDGMPCGLDYFRALGVTHVQFMPIYDFGSIDESLDNIHDEHSYNWGYDPVNYMAPEGSFSTDPHDGAVRIRELKCMIAAFHSAGMGVIMDVVFNHTFSLDSSLQRTVPDYYYRKDGENYSNGSACGNEIASDRPMVRKYIIDCLTYWLTEYHLDGFRFDLMGCLDLETMSTIDTELRRIRPDILLYGEGWLGGDSVLPLPQRSIKAQLANIPGIGAFSDDIRDGIRGHVFEDHTAGFVGGAPNKENDIRFSIVGACKHPGVDYKNYTYSPDGPWATTPNRVINYASCHDNMTLWDRICYSRKDAPLSERLAMNRLAAAIVFTSQGVPFFLHGEEILRSKEFCDNSYNRPLTLNAVDYHLNNAQHQMLHFYRKLIELRKATPELHLTTDTAVEEHVTFLSTPRHSSLVAFTVDNLLVVYNASNKATTIPAPLRGYYFVLLHGTEIDTSPIRRRHYRAGESITIDAISCFIARIQEVL